MNKTASSKKKLLTSAVLLSIGGFVSSANADLASGSLGLQVEGNLNPVCLYGGTYPDCTYGAFDTADAGSYFLMDGSPGGAIDGNNAIPLMLDGSAQSFNGTPISLGNPYIGDNIGPIATWDFFGSLGTNTHAGLIAGGGDTTIDMSTWEVNWGEVAIIDMGGDPANFPEDTGIATLVCTGGADATCELGDTFTLDYSAHVPVGDPSNFGGVLYGLHLQGTIVAPDTTPDPFDFDSPIEVDFNTQIVSEERIISGMMPNLPVDISISTGFSNEYCIGDTAFCADNANYTSAAGVIIDGETVRVRHTTTGGLDDVVTTTLTIGTGTGDFVTTNIATDTDPDELLFPDVVAATDTLVTSATIAVAGINSPAPISIGINNGSMYSIDSGAYTNVAGTINNGQTVTIQHQSSAIADTVVLSTLTIGTIDSFFQSTTAAADTEPDPFSFANGTQLDVPLNTLLTSGATAAIAGINTAAPISVTNGEYSFDGITWTDIAGTVNAGQTVEVRHTSAATVSTVTITTLDIGGVTADFTTTTERIDTAPDPFAFDSQTDIVRNAQVTSNSIILTGFNTAATVSIDVGEFSIDGGVTFLTTGTVDPDTSVLVRHTAAATGGTDTVSTLDVGSVLGTFTSTTVANIVPVAAPDSATLDVSVAASISLDVTANDSDADGDIDRETVAIVDHPVYGLITGIDTVTGVVTYTPTPGVFGVDSYTYTIDDNEGGKSLAATVTIDVPDPDAVGGGLPDDALLPFTLGTFSGVPVDGEGSWFFMAGGDYTAIESFNGIQLGTEQPASGSHSGAPDGTERKNIDNPWLFFSNTGMHQTTSKVTILSASGDTAALDFAGWDVTWNGIDSIPMGAGAHSGGTEGVAAVTCAVDCSVGDTYILNYYGTVPDGDASGFGGIEYTVHLEGSITQGSIPETAPVAYDDAAGVVALGTVTIDLTDNVTDAFGNPADIDFTTLTYGYVGTATLVNNGDGTLTYTDVGDVDAVDSFTYRVSDTSGQSTNTATVIVTVAAAGTNLPPTATSFSDRTTKGTSVEIDVALKTGDPDGTVDFSTVSASQSILGNGTTSVAVMTGLITYTPNASFTGSDSFTYTIKDNDGATSNIATVTVIVNDPPFADNDLATVDRHSSTSASVTSVDIDVTFNDTDSDGTIDPATVAIVTPVSNGFTDIDPVTGVVTYTPDVNYLGPDSFTYEVNDNAGFTSNVATVDITVSNAVPVANDDSASIEVSVTGSVAVDVLDNDTDADGTIDESTVVIITNASNGVAIIDSVTGIVTYTPNAGFVGSDEFTYTVNDNDGATSNVATVIISVSNSGTAVLPDDATLTIVPATITGETVNITPPDGAGSWFNMEVSPGVLTHVSLQGFNQLQLGTIQPGSEASPNIDAPWLFFGQLGAHQTTAAVTILSDDGEGNVTLALSGWSVAWNNIADIPMSEGAHTPGFVDGVAIMTCANDCSADDSYKLEYSARVPEGDPSGFGNVKYFLHLEGIVSLDAPTLGGGDADAPYVVTETDATTTIDDVAVDLDVIAGSTADSVGNTSGINLTAADIGLKDPKLNENDGQQCIGGCVDFVISGVPGGGFVDLVVKLNEAMPEGTIYRKLLNGVWVNFDESQGGQIGSAASIDGACQGPEGIFEIGLRAGNDCLFMRIFDNGPNDADSTTGTIADPSGILLAGSPNVPPGSTSSGCSISSTKVDLTERADWLVVAGFIVWLGLIGYRRKKAVN